MTNPRRDDPAEEPREGAGGQPAERPDRQPGRLDRPDEGSNRFLATPRQAVASAGSASRMSAGSALAAAPSVLALIGGVWLIVSRLVFNYGTIMSGSADGLINGVIIGIVVTLVATVQLSNSDANPGLSLANAVFGGWMIASPWVYGYDQWGSGSRPAWSDVIVGAVILVTSLSTFLGGATTRARSAHRAV